jgi:SAM-dependent methyltransferase
VSKRDDDSQTDMEVGMTTAERRRRRRRGGGLRVPSDNVPRRASTPPVVAPVPEDPSLAMSIAYTFSEHEARSSATSFDSHEALPTVIDPVSGPLEQVDFEMKTREMTAVDLEALGLQEAAASGTAIPVQRMSSPGIDPWSPWSANAALAPEAHDVAVKKRATTDPAEVEIEVEPQRDGATLDRRDDRDDHLVREPVLSAAAELFDPGPLYRPGRAQTVALSEEDLEEVREAARLATQPAARLATQPAARLATQPAPPLATQPAPPPHLQPAPPPHLQPAPPTRSGSPSTPPPMPSARPADVKHRPPDPGSVPEIDILALEDRAAEASGEYEVDVDGIVDARPAGPGSAGGSQVVAVSVVPAAQPPPALPLEARARTLPPPLSHSTTIPPANAVGSRDAQPTPIARDGLQRDSQPMAIARDAPPGPATASLRESQPLPASREGQHVPPPPPVSHKAPPAPPPAKKDKAVPVAGPLARPGAAATPEAKPGRSKPWFVDLFDEDYLRTLPFLTPQATQAEAEFVIDAMGLSPGAQVLDVGCGYGRHAMELAARGFHVVGLDMSTPLLVRGGEEAHRRGLTINFVRGDMRELDFENQFDGAYCLFSTFGYFDDETNKRTVSNIARALRPGGRVLIEILNRDYVIADLPTRVWWEGDGCVVLEEVDLNYFSSRIQVNRSVVFDDGRQLEQEISVRAYSLHEVGKLLHAAGFRVLEVSGAYHTRGRFFGNQSRHIIVLAERKDPAAT